MCSCGHQRPAVRHVHGSSISGRRPRRQSTRSRHRAECPPALPPAAPCSRYLRRHTPDGGIPVDSARLRGRCGSGFEAPTQSREDHIEALIELTLAVVRRELTGQRAQPRELMDGQPVEAQPQEFIGLIRVLHVLRQLAKRMPVQETDVEPVGVQRAPTIEPGLNSSSRFSSGRKLPSGRIVGVLGWGGRPPTGDGRDPTAAQGCVDRRDRPEPASSSPTPSWPTWPVCSTSARGSRRSPGCGSVKGPRTRRAAAPVPQTGHRPVEQLGRRLIATNTNVGQIAWLDARHRSHVPVENDVKQAKDLV